MPRSDEAAAKAVAERDRLYRRYRVAKRAEQQELFATPIHGEKLRRFNATLGHFKIDGAERLIDYVREEARSWLHEAPDDIRFGALQLVSHRIQRIRARAGLCVFDDPLPGEADDVWQLCRKELA